MADIESTKDVKRLIDTFYDRLLASEIAYIFTDVAQIDLEHHLPILYRFWNQVLFYTNEYSGNPMQIHLDLNRKTSLTSEAFDTWLGLFNATVDDLYAGPKADEAKQKAKSIALLMQVKMNQ